MCCVWGSVPGWMSLPELEWLHNTASRLPAGSTWVELGTFAGRSLLCVALSLPEQSRLVAVDHKLGRASASIDPRPKDVERDLAWRETLEIILDRRPDLSLITARATNTVMAHLVSAATADVVFIDADHTYDATRENIRLWRDKLKPGGLLAGHDYNPEDWPDVVRAVDEFGGQPVAGSIWQLP